MKHEITYKIPGNGTCWFDSVFLFNTMRPPTTSTTIATTGITERHPAYPGGVCQRTQNGCFETSAYPETPARKDAGTVFQAASLNKPVFAYIVLKMAYEGLLDLDVPLATYTDIERFEDKERARLLTARMVLCHVTGLSIGQQAPARRWPRSTISFIRQPGSTFTYSGEGFAFCSVLWKLSMVRTWNK